MFEFAPIHNLYRIINKKRSYRNHNSVITDRLSEMQIRIDYEKKNLVIYYDKVTSKLH